MTYSRNPRRRHAPLGGPDDLRALSGGPNAPRTTARLGRTRIEGEARSRILFERRQTEERLRIAAEAARIGVYDYDVLSNTIQWDARVRELWGVGAGEPITYDTFLSGVHPDDRAATRAAVARAMTPDPSRPDGRAKFAAEYRVVNRRDGVTRWIAATGNVAFRGGRAVRLVGTAQDITERRRAEEERRRSEGLFRTVAEANLIGVGVGDLSGRVEYVNDEMLRMMGHTRRDFEEGKLDWTQAIAPEFDGVNRRSIEVLLRDGVSVGYEKAFLRPDGERTPFLGAGALVDRGTGLHVSIALDLTAIKKAESQLREVDRRKNEFLAVLSHELRNPLAPIKNGLAIMERTPPGGPQARRAQEIVSRQVDQLARLVDDLLDVTRITRGKIQTHRRRLELDELVRRTIDDHRTLFDAADLRLEVETSPYPLFVCGDANRLAQVIGNLLQNAIKFTPPQGWVRVTLEADHAAGQAVVRVADSGVGIAPEVLARLFEPFMQADASLDRSKGGLGLGLTLVKGLVEQHGGTVFAKSRGLGHGTEFTLRLPLDLPHHALDPSGVQAPGMNVRLRVLIIEDNVDAAESLRELLRLDGHEVAVAYTGPEGLERAQTFQPEFVLCDIGLPGLDGYALARALRANPRMRATRLVAVSGYALPEDVDRAREAGFDEHLSKPVNLERLTWILRDLGAPHRGQAG